MGCKHDMKMSVVFLIRFTVLNILQNWSGNVFWNLIETSSIQVAVYFIYQVGFLIFFNYIHGFDVFSAQDSYYCL